MAAVYLHNALYARNPPEPRDSLVHSRNLSTISSATLLTSTTVHSHPNEPLLHPTATAPATAAYFEQLSRQPRNPDGTPARLRWDDRVTLDGGHPPGLGEKGRPWRRGRIRRPEGPWGWAKMALEIVMAAWATYNAVRYFFAFSAHSDTVGQTFCLALGTCAGVSFALAFSAKVLGVLKPKLLIQSVGYKYLKYVRATLFFLSSFALLVPAAVNFALVFFWKDSSHPQLSLAHRCRVDVDVVWSVHGRDCDPAVAWSTWVIISTVRLALTLTAVIAYHAISFLHPETCRRPIHRHLRSESFASTPSILGDVPSPSTLGTQRQASEATLVDESSSRHPSRTRLARSRSSGLSGESCSGEPLSFGLSSVVEAAEVYQNTPVDGLHSSSQITHETEEAVGGARSDGALSPDVLPRGRPPSYSADYDHYDDDDSDESDERIYDRPSIDPENLFNLPRVPPTLGYNEFGLPYPPDQNVRVLNGVIRRMPTIESMGSGEVGSLGASSHQGNGSMYTSSRPPTRNTLLSFSDYDPQSSNPPSRANSLSVRAEMLPYNVNKRIVSHSNDR
ncbi:hypothetical protein NLJ89_g4594 [Agrocybe chaxingu]|uniref:Uncharacterized protein n=1 Tax=Agrocybe chaxingu TaxID=84603 RepID=A0A9W8K2B9_9AGAR|nr:hypothetical protein NLJ89_g4594 [Agrocybe chaxingu]